MLDPLLEAVMAIGAARYPPLAQPEHTGVAPMRIEVVDQRRLGDAPFQLAVRAQRIVGEMDRARRLPAPAIAPRRCTASRSLICAPAWLACWTEGARLRRHGPQRATGGEAEAALPVAKVRRGCLKGSRTTRVTRQRPTYSPIADQRSGAEQLYLRSGGILRLDPVPGADFCGFQPPCLALTR